MTIPRATYRLQFHRGLTLRDALDLVPYLSALGVSHVYAAPLLKARPGSLHGYDVCDPTQINPEIGGEADLEAFVAALRERGMGLVVDIVPNHMAAAPENPWWWDVLKQGRQSRFADYFDIDWESPKPGWCGKVLVPVLGDEYERVLERGELQVACEDAEVTVRYFEHRFPVEPESILVPGKFLQEAIADFNSDRKAMAWFLEQQHYRLACWRRGDTDLNYRRFFAIAHLAGVRVELPKVFADMHNRILDWHQRGLLEGLRVDHPDGLRDPRDYLQRLKRAAPGAWIVVEKILEPGEDLPADWPVAGTTGYDFLCRVTELFTDPAGEKPLTSFYAEFTGEPTDCAAVVRANKHQVLRQLFTAEVSRLVSLLARSLARRASPGSASLSDLREALIELMACFPVYRTYAPSDTGLLSAADQAQVSVALAQALKFQPSLSATLASLGDLLQSAEPDDLRTEFVVRFQQLTGPAMAKGVEDTVYYCFNRFVALNEVGGDPARFGLSVEEFHRACGQARQQWPHTMVSTSTHDTKRSEDVRARLALLSEVPERWISAVRRWSALTARHRRGGWPDRNAEYLFYQTLVGAWPLPPERAWAYMEKAAREAKQHTDWNDPNAAYETALQHFVTSALGDAEFTRNVGQFVASLMGAGYVNSIAQTLLKLTAPGVPDIYQGTDLWDLSLVDPDNRRLVDFARRGDALFELQRRVEGEGLPKVVHELLQHSGDGRLKLFVIHRALQFRARSESLFRDGSYVPLRAIGRQADHLCAFARILHNTAALTLVPRLVLRLTGREDRLPLGEPTWGDTRLVLPRAQAGSAFRNILTGEILFAREDSANASLPVAEVLGRFPVALLEKCKTPAETAATNNQVI